jgi:hypothetical protein
MAMLVDHGGGVWTATSEMRLPAQVWMPLRMTVVRLDGGDLWVHSPIAAQGDLVDEVAALGPVRYLVAPNRLHHLHLAGWSDRFPAAELWGAEGLAAKRPDLRFTGTLGGGGGGAGATDAASPWHRDVESIPIAGSPKIGETVFHHRASGTLIVTDLLFNVHTTRGLVTPWLLRLSGTHRRLAQSRAWRFGIADRAALAASGRRVLALGPARLVVAHGDVVDPLPPGALERALAWMSAPRQLRSGA